MVGLQGLLAAGVAVAFVLRGLSAGALNGNVAGEAGYFLVVGVALLAVGGGLLVGRRWARTPAIVTQLLLLPVVYSLIGPSRQVLLGALAGAYVLTAFLLLISERSRLWWMDPPEPENPE
jgi:hypothetical protein